MKRNRTISILIASCLIASIFVTSCSDDEKSQQEFSYITESAASTNDNSTEAQTSKTVSVIDESIIDTSDYISEAGSDAESSFETEASNELSVSSAQSQASEQSATEEHSSTESVSTKLISEFIYDDVDGAKFDIGYKVTRTQNNITVSLYYNNINFPGGVVGADMYIRYDASKILATGKQAIIPSEWGSDGEDSSWPLGQVVNNNGEWRVSIFNDGNYKVPCGIYDDNKIGITFDFDIVNGFKGDVEISIRGERTNYPKATSGELESIKGRGGILKLTLS